MATFQANYDNRQRIKLRKLRHHPEIEMVASLYNLGEIKMPEDIHCIWHIWMTRHAILPEINLH